MKKLLLILLLFVVATSTSAQKRGGALTLAELDSQVVQKYNSFSPKLNAIIDEYNKMTDSTKRAAIEKQYNALQAECDAQMLGIYTKNLKVDGITKRIFALRTSIPKDQLEKIYKKLSPDVKRDDQYAKSIRLHIDTHQIQIGDTLGDFKASTSEGHQFSYGEFKDEKDVLLIFGNLNSIPIDARILLQVSYRDVDLSKLEIISVFTDDIDKAQFEATANQSGCEWLKISDLKGEHSPLKIAFGVEATPMCFYVSRGGAVEYISLGIDDIIIDLIKQQSYKNRK